MKRNLSVYVLLFCLVGTIWSVPPDDRTYKISKTQSVFNSVLREVDMSYVDTLNYEKLTQKAINGMLEETDPYTVYIPEEETEDIAMMTKGEYGGIGALISKKGDSVFISEPYEGMPAQRNGINAGDVILEIDSVSTEGMSVSDVSSRLRGIPSTSITIKLRRPGEEGILEKTFLREKIQMNAISYSAIVAPGVGYLLLNDFTDHAAIEIRQTVTDMVEKEQIKALIIDVRDNGGGLIDEAVKIVGFFVPKGTEVVSTKGRSKRMDRSYKTPSEPVFPDLKLAVLTNRSSASASEILAGAIQDLDRGVIIGERTFGKGLVQSIRPISYGGYVKVTTAKYYIPSGRSIQAIDYSNRNKDGSVGRVPEHLTSEYLTKNGRKVRDGGGITPDSIIVDERKFNIAHYIYMDNLYFDYATEYFYKHPSIPTPDVFELTDSDFNSFVDYLMEKKFTYTTQTEKYYDELIEIAKYEGLYNRIADDFESLKSKLIPDINTNLTENKKDIIDLLSLEIIKRYFYQKGEIQYSLRSDKELKTAVSLLKNENIYNSILTKK